MVKFNHCWVVNCFSYLASLKCEYVYLPSVKSLENVKQLNALDFLKQASSINADFGRVKENAGLLIATFGIKHTDLERLWKCKWGDCSS